MGVFTFEDETTSVVAPARLYKALVKDADNLIPKAVEAIKSVETVEGNGGPGTIKKLTFVEGDKTKYVLHRVDAIDEVNFVYNFSIIGGTGLADNLEKVSFESKLVEGPNGGSIRKVHVQYFTKGDAKLSEEELKAGQAKVEGLVKLVEGYLLANPDY
ncbi:class-10 pathogenesis-related protein 1-like isoform X2 [Gastrolobium bilobum]|uniref:class-10 pathogenesis-related protein 1-like isoform X2 n=1 Tax=Gastrolobium bilobum TaxID=150636 RepID=UPI002AB24893|nr:class-10 pathogenesis-related protein 1-like isoform X2 [Gastrolobium bilobum]